MSKKGKEIQRTCSRCGTVWFVPLGQKEIKQAKATGWATPMIGKRRNELRAQQAQIEIANALVAQSGQCRSCGSSSYVEAVVKV